MLMEQQFQTIRFETMLHSLVEYVHDCCRSISTE